MPDFQSFEPLAALLWLIRDIWGIDGIDLRLLLRTAANYAHTNQNYVFVGSSLKPPSRLCRGMMGFARFAYARGL